jgi:hypothetical protein
VETLQDAVWLHAVYRTHGDAGRHLFNRQAVLRLFCALLAEPNDEWSVGRHRSFSYASMAKILNPKQDLAAPLPPEAAAAWSTTDRLDRHVDLHHSAGRQPGRARSRHCIAGFSPPVALR